MLLQTTALKRVMFRNQPFKFVAPSLLGSMRPYSPPSNSMKNNRKYLAFALGLIASMIGSTPAAANTSFTFTYDVSQFDQAVNFATGDSLTIEFETGTDLYNITTSDIFSFKYNLAAGATATFYRGAGWASDFGDLGSHFSYNGSALTIMYDNVGSDFIQQSSGGQFAQIVGGQPWHAFTTFLSGGNAYLTLWDANDVVYISSSPTGVPDGGNILLLVGATLGGLAMVRRRFPAA